LVRSELSKAADAAALAGVKNISNPNVTVETIARQIGDENFPAGQLGTPGSGKGSISFTTTKPGNNKVKVVGQVSAIAFLARLFGIEQVSTSSSGVAQRKDVEIMMVLDSQVLWWGNRSLTLRQLPRVFWISFKRLRIETKWALSPCHGGKR